jgi:hypothetical protein
VKNTKVFQPVNTLLVFGFLMLAAGISRADFHVWTGAASGYWSNTNNWQGGDAPHIFETTPIYINLPSGAAHLTVTNDISYGIFGSLAVDSLIVGDNYTIYGKSGGTNIILTGNPAPFFGINLQNLYCTGGFIVFDGGLNLILNNTNTITNSIGSFIYMQATLSGSGGWTFEGLGTLDFAGVNPNTYQGPCTVLSGEVELEQFNNQYLGDYAPSISSPLTIGTTNTGVPALEHFHKSYSVTGV